MSEELLGCILDLKFQGWINADDCIDDVGDSNKKIVKQIPIFLSAFNFQMHFPF